MLSTRLGASGLVVSRIGLGCDNLGRPGTMTEHEQGATSVVRTAFDVGVTYFDVADVYGSPRGRAEELLGNALGPVRDQVAIGTKFGMDAHGANGPDFGARGSRRYIRQAVEASLTRLGTDWIDLYQLHRPDPLTPLAETMTALDELVRAGKVRYVAVSNLAGWQIADASWICARGNLAAPIAAQNHWSLLDRECEREVVPACRRFDMAVLPYFPLANGLLTGKYRRSAPAPKRSRLADRPGVLNTAPWERIEALREFAKARGVSMTEVAIGWLAAQQAVSAVVAGATTVDQVLENTSVTWTPSTADLAELDTICPPGK